MISYIDKVPGLIHFILVDRTSNRILAPRIGALIGHACPLRAKLSDKQGKILKVAIWDLVYQAQSFLARGNSTLTNLLLTFS